MLGEFNIQQFVSAFVVLFAVIDVTCQYLHRQ